MPSKSGEENKAWTQNTNVGKRKRKKRRIRNLKRNLQASSRYPVQWRYRLSSLLTLLKIDLRRRTMTSSWERKRQQGPHKHTFGSPVEDPETGITTQKCQECGLIIESEEFWTKEKKIRGTNMGERESNWRGSHMLPKRRNTFDAIFFSISLSPFSFYLFLSSLSSFLYSLLCISSRPLTCIA